MGKIKAKGWTITWCVGMEAPYYVTITYLDENGRHEISKDFKTYAAAFGWLSKKVEL